MAWGYGSDDVSLGLVLSLLIQVAVLCVLLSRRFRERTLRRSPWPVATGGAVVVLNQALLEALSPSLGVGITSGALALLVLAPLSLVNAVLVAVRTPTRGDRAPLFLPLLMLVAYWTWRIASLRAGGPG